MQPEISVIVPIYNPGKFLPACLDSLTRQDFASYEVLLVNDGSSDNSPEICRQYAEKFPGLIRFFDYPNGGSSVARNRGLEQAAGKWISFCDSDDIVEPGFLSTLHRQAEAHGAQLSCCALVRAEETGHPHIEMITTVKGEVVWNREEVQKNLIHPFLRLGDPASVAVRGYIVLSLFRHEIIQKGHLRFPPGMAINQDEAFFFEYLQYVDCAVLSDRVCYHYNSVPTSAVHRLLQRKKRIFTKREKFWCMRHRERYRVYREYHLERIFPEAAAILYFRARYHELQSIYCDQELGKAERRKKFQETFLRFREEPQFQQNQNSPLPREIKFFLFSVRLGCATCRLFCKLVELGKNWRS